MQSVVSLIYCVKEGDGTCLLARKVLKYGVGEGNRTPYPAWEAGIQSKATNTANQHPHFGRTRCGLWKMERETRIELVTNSLEDCTYIENKG